MNEELLPTYATRYPAITDPTVAELLKLTQRDDIISFAGGTPFPGVYPTDLLNEALQKLDSNWQYSPTGGLPVLRELVAEQYSQKWGMKLTSENVLITTGSQQALDAVARLYLDDGDRIEVTDPTYFVALYAFNSYAPHYEVIDPQDTSLGEVKSKLNTKFLYLVPSFQNPKGTTLTKKERQVVATHARENDLIIVEDDPYGELYFGAPPPLPIYTHAPERTIYTTTVSKTLAPGLRLGIVIGPEKIIQDLTLVKQGMDLCTSGFDQQIAAYVMGHKQYEAHLAKIRKYYGDKAGRMLVALKKNFPKKSGVTWTKPTGGMFIWVTLPEGMDAKELYPQVIEKAKVAYVPGYIFSPSGGLKNCLRLGYAVCSDEEIEKGIGSLGAEFLVK